MLRKLDQKEIGIKLLSLLESSLKKERYLLLLTIFLISLIVWYVVKSMKSVNKEDVRDYIQENQGKEAADKYYYKKKAKEELKLEPKFETGFGYKKRLNKRIEELKNEDQTIDKEINKSEVIEMNENKVRVQKGVSIRAREEISLTKEINKWIEENLDKEIIDIQYTPPAYTDPAFTAFIRFK